MKFSQQAKKNKSNDSKKSNYQVYFDYKVRNNFHLNRSIISENEKYLAIALNNGYIQQQPQSQLLIIDIKKKLTLFVIRHHKQMGSIQFSKDSRLIFVSSLRSLRCISVRNKKIVFKIKTRGFIDNILAISRNLILYNSTQTIVKYNINMRQKLIYVNNPHPQNFNSLDYDEENKMVVSSFSDSCIKFFNFCGKVIVQEKQAHKPPIHHCVIKLTQKNDQLLSCDYKTIKLWQIDYLNSKLIELRNFDCYSFSLNYHQGLIFVISKDQICILDYNFNVIQWMDLDSALLSLGYFDQAYATNTLSIVGKYKYLQVFRLQ